MGSTRLRHAPTMTYVAVGLALLAVLPFAMKSVVIAGLLVVILVMVILILWRGIDGASVVMMFLAFGLAPADKLGVSFLGVSDVFFFVAMALAFPRLMRTPVKLPAPFVLAALGFVIMALLSTTGGAGISVYYYTARVIFMFVILPVLVVWWAPRGKVLVGLLVVYGVGTGISVLYGLPKVGAYRNYGLTQHPNVLGYTATLTLSLLPFLYFALSPQRRVWICGSLLALSGVGVLTSGSRAALVVALFLAILVPAVERSIPMALAVAATGVVGIALIGERASPTEGQNALSRLLGAGDAAQSDQARVDGLDQTLHLAVTHPLLGTGFDLTEFLGHNVYAQVAAAVGFIGVAAFIALLLSMVTPLFATDSIYSRLVYPAVVFIVAGPVSPQLTDRYIGLLFGIALVGANLVDDHRRAEAVSQSEAVPLRLNK